MPLIAVLASPRTFAASLGAMTDLHARLGEVFESNAALGDYARVETRLTIAPALAGPVDLAGGRPLPCDATLSTMDTPRLVYLPSFQVTQAAQLDDMLASAAPFHHWLRALPAATAIGAGGASVFHLAAAGLLDRGPCVVPARLIGLFRERFPRLAIDEPRSLCVAEGPRTIVTCSRDAQAGALALRLFAAAFSHTLAVSLALREPPAGDPGFATDEPDPIVARARSWIRDRFARDFRITDLAAELGLSHQALIRRFRAAGGDTPRGYVQRLRCQSAAAMLRETRRPVAEIAQLVGYRDMASFRTVFTAETGQAPSAWRRSHALPPGDA